ncbi:hypothetical protein, partial [Bifidobacterium bifidum]
MAERAAMKNIKDMFSNIFPDVPCRKRKDKESISQYLKDVYSILFTILKNKKTTENVKDYEKKLIAIRIRGCGCFFGRLDGQSKVFAV